MADNDRKSPNGNATPAEQIALFRYGIIAPILHDSTNGQTRYFKQMAQKVFDVPIYGRKKYNWKTFKSWLRAYRTAGFDGLKPKTRTDKGSSRMVDDYLAQVIQQKYQQFPSLNAALHYRMLVDEGYIHQGAPCEATVRKYIQQHQLKPQPDPPQPRKKFEKPHINDLWLSDFMHGQRFMIDHKQRKLFLCGVIDDHSRLLVGCQWTLQENTEALELVLKDALLTYGLPKILYCDNGAVYASQHLQLVCARLGIALVHSKPYDSPARGKIERFWRTIRECFLPMVPKDRNYSLEEFNHLFREWLDKDYHRKFHHGILQPPLDRYLDDVKDTNIRRIQQHELELHFYQTYHRKVKNDATISVTAVLFEVPAKYIGTNIELRHPTGQPFELWIYEQDQPVIKIYPVDPIFNSNLPTNGIKFATHNQQEDQSC